MGDISHSSLFRYSDPVYVGDGLSRKQRRRFSDRCRTIVSPIGCQWWWESTLTDINIAVGRCTLVGFMNEEK